MSQQTYHSKLPDTYSRSLSHKVRDQGESSGDMIVIVIKGGKVVRFENNAHNPGLELTDGDGI